MRICAMACLSVLIACDQPGRKTPDATVGLPTASVASASAPTPSTAVSVVPSVAPSVSAAPTPSVPVECHRAADCVPNDVCWPTQCVPPRRAKTQGSCPDIVPPDISCECIKGKCEGTSTPRGL